MFLDVSHSKVEHLLDATKAVIIELECTVAKYVLCSTYSHKYKTCLILAALEDKVQT